MTTVIADTNVWLRVILNDVPDQATDFKKYILEAKRSTIELVVPAIVVFELQFILEKYYKLPKNDVVDKLKVLLSTQYITIESRQIFSLALNLYSVNNISFVDCFILAQSNQTHATLYAPDKKLAALAKKGS